MKALKIVRSQSFQQFFGESVITKMRERTSEGVSKTGSNFKAYSKSYLDSFAFKVFGKQKSPVNMELTGQMLSSLTYKQVGTTLTVQFDNEFAAAKADGHINGVPGRLPKRDFFGLPSNVLQELFKEAIKSEASGALDNLSINEIPNGTIDTLLGFDLNSVRAFL